MRQDPMRRCWRSASRGVCVNSPAITVEIISPGHQLSLHSYGFASKVRRCYFNGRRVLRRGSSVVSAARRRRRVWLAEGAVRLTPPPAAASMPSEDSLWPSLCRHPCTAQGLRTRWRRSVQPSAAPSLGLRITRRSRRHLPAGRTWHHVHSLPCAASR
jgi:hypothetical protein